jgi:uncharacterized protein YfaS (alpha-2-macroglobulin family)
MNITKIAITLFGLLSLNTAFAAQGNNAESGNGSNGYESLWKQVNTYKNKDLPRDVISVCNKIYNQADKENNGTQMVKAFMTRYEYRGRIDPDSAKADQQYLKNWQKGEKRAVLRSVLSYYLANISNDTTKIRYVKESLKDADALASVTATKEWKELLRNKGAKSDFFSHDMYSMMLNENIQILDNADNNDLNLIKQLYQEGIDYYNAKGNRDAVLLLTLDRLDMMKEKGLSNDNYYSQLEKLKSQYADCQTSAEINLLLARKAISEKKFVEALGILNEAIDKFPSYLNINALKNAIEDVKAKEMDVSQIPEQQYPGEPYRVKVHYRNTDNIALHVYKFKTPNGYDDYMDMNELKKKAALLHSYTFNLNTNTDYSFQDTCLTIPGLDYGCYAIVVQDKVLTTTVSKLYTLHRSIDNKTEVVVVDSKTGKPVKGANVQVIDNNKKNVIGSYSTDNEGKVSFTRNKDNYWLSFLATKDNDKWLQKCSINNYGNYYGHEDSNTSYIIQLFSDRAIYRPGQMVHVNGVVYSQLKDDASIIANKKINVFLRDANYKQLSKTEVTTNDFGSFTTDFTLPQNVLNGNFSIIAQSDKCTKTLIFSVEEYKRPTFEVKIDEVKDSYKLGETVNVKGSAKSYSGIALAGDSVKFTVTRSPRIFYWWWRVPASDVKTQEGKAVVNEDGTFTMPIQLLPDSIYDFYRYKIDASVTSPNGETRNDSYTLCAGKQPYILSTDIEKEININENIEGKFTANNPQGNGVAITIHALLKDKAGKIVWKDDHIASNTTIKLEAWKSFKPGIYTIHADDGTDKIKFERPIVLFSDKSDVMPADTVCWYKKMNEEFPRDGKPATILFGTSRKDVFVMYSVFGNGNLIENKTFTMNNELKKFSYTYKPEYGDGINVVICFVNEGVTYQHSFTIKKPLPDKNLSMKWTRFRDKIEPGKKETWSLTILNNKKDPANAEMMATLYDASLDAFRKYSANNNVNYSRYVYGKTWSSYSIDGRSASLDFSHKTYRTVVFDYDRLNVYDLSDSFIAVLGYGSVKVRGARPMMMMAKANAVSESEVQVFDSPDGAPQTQNKPIEAGTATTAPEEQEEAPIKSESLRENFNETAFFYPQLTTDEKGNITFSFTMPESLTKWNFIGLAHTRDMQTGTISGSTATAKDFMVNPNLPRFVRVGDKASIGVMINNTSASAVSGNAKMQLFDPATDKVISTQSIPFSVNANGSTAVSFTFNPSEDYPLLGVKIIAEGGNFSDGEQHLLPVLSDKQYVTETVPMFVRGNQTKTFNISNLFNNHSNTATQRKMIVEATGNPAWYAVQALPTISEPRYDDAISWAVAWYANSLAAYIANSQPRIKKIFDTWRSQGVDSKTLWSKLQKNEDVKNIVLNESPWVAEAQSQTEQQQRVATLFDINNISYLTDKSIKKLLTMQNSEGGWSWFAGMPSNLYTTMYITKLIARYNHLLGKNENKEMLTRSMAYINKEIAEDYNNCIKHKITPSLGNIEIEYLYLTAMTGAEVSSAAQKAYDFYMKEAQKSSPKLTIQGKAVVSYILNQCGKGKIAREMIESMRQYAVHTEEGGTFYNASADRYSWWGNPLVTQTAAIEAFSNVAHDSTYVDELQIALLKRKQAQDWGNNVSTADAVYSLLCTGNNLLASEGKYSITLSGGNVTHEIQEEQREAGTQYMRTTIDNPSIRDLVTKATFSKKDAGVAWGAVYGCSLENIGKFGEAGNAITITKKYVKAGKEVKEWHVGDVITTMLTIHVDRDMDFVQLSDSRPACAEPGVATSGYQWNSGVGYYIDIKDASTRYFFDRLRKGTYTLEYNCTVDRAGEYQSGLATIQSAYAPEFAAHSKSATITVK